MAIVCDQCRVNVVDKNGLICEDCINANEMAKIDTSLIPGNKIYLPDDLFVKFKKLHDELLPEKPRTYKAYSKFLNAMKTSFINKLTGKEINDPTPSVIIPQEKTLDRIQKILNHNLAVYAAHNNMDTPEDIEDWNVPDMYSDDWEESLYQYVDNIEIMEEDNPDPPDPDVVSSPEDLAEDDPPSLT